MKPMPNPLFIKIMDILEMMKDNKDFGMNSIITFLQILMANMKIIMNGTMHIGMNIN